jgi:hypothetical protein
MWTVLGDNTFAEWKDRNASLIPAVEMAKPTIERKDT